MPQIFELRTYFAYPGRMPALLARFRDHTCRLFRKHGMTIVGFWNPVDADDGARRLIYLLSYSDQAAANKAWDAFRADPEWQTAKAESERDAPIVEKIESLFLAPTDFSPLR